jgi:hypothetical protein
MLQATPAQCIPMIGREIAGAILPDDSWKSANQQQTSGQKTIRFRAQLRLESNRRAIEWRVRSILQDSGKAAHP